MQHLWQDNLEREGQLRYRSYLLADQLRQSSDDLTRMVRAYIVTGERRFEKEVLPWCRSIPPYRLKPSKAYFFHTGVERALICTVSLPGTIQ